jgi:hypothetical protein
MVLYFPLSSARFLTPRGVLSRLFEDLYPHFSSFNVLHSTQSAHIFLCEDDEDPPAPKKGEGKEAVQDQDLEEEEDSSESDLMENTNSEGQSFIGVPPSPPPGLKPPDSVLTTLFGSCMAVFGFAVASLIHHNKNHNKKNDDDDNAGENQKKDSN